MKIKLVNINSDKLYVNRLDVSIEYTVYAIVKYKEENDLFCLINNGTVPYFYDVSDFIVIDNSLPSDWRISLNTKDDMVDYIIGFNEIVSNKDFRNNLLLEKLGALNTYYNYTKL